MADQFPLPPGATAATPDASQDTGRSTSTQQFALPPGATPAQQTSGTSASEPTFNGPVAKFIGKVGTATGEGVDEGVGDLWGMVKAAPAGIWHLLERTAADPTSVVPDVIKHPIDAYHTDLQRALPIVNEYEKSRAGGKSVLESLDAANNQARTMGGITGTIAQKINDLQKNPTREGVRDLTDIVGVLAASYGLGQVGEAMIPEEGAAVAPAGEAATATLPAESETAATTAKVPEATDFNSPSKPSLAQQVASETAAPPTPAEAATAKAVAKSGLPAGSPASVAPTGEDIQPTLHQGVRDFVNNTHADAGLPPVPDTTSVLDVPQQSADAFQARSQSTFQKVEDITKVNPTTLRDIMSARADQVENFLAAGKDEEAGNLQQLQLNDENRMAKAFNDAKKQGVDVDQARSDWNKSLRADELSSAVRSSKSSASTLANPEIDPSKLTPKLQKLYESQPGGKTAKLAQLGGDDNATKLVETAENARGSAAAIKDFEPTSATGQKAMQDILRPNTGSRVVGTGMKTNFLKSLDDFEKLSPAEQTERFPGSGEVEQARSYLKSQARWQVGKRIAAGVGIAVIASSLGVTGALIHALME